MGQVLHKRATTTHAIRAEIQRSSASIQSLSRQFGVNPKTVAKWKKRDTVEDAPMGAKRPNTVLSEQDEALICAFRRKTELPLDDCLLALQDQIPPLTRSNLHRCLQRHGLSRLPKPEKPAKKAFKSYEIGYMHVDICEVRIAEGKRYLFVGVDRTSKFVFAEVYSSATTSAAARFMRNLALAVPYRIHTVLSDNGIQFTYRALAKPPKNKTHPFDTVCAEMNIEHRLTKPNHPWTNGQVERMNRTLKDATVSTYHYDTEQAFNQHLHAFLRAYNHARKLKALKWMTPAEKIYETFKRNPDIFHSDPHQYSLGLNT
ncbi:MAG: IS481 family transposase [Pseudomonadota bacterium]